MSFTVRLGGFLNNASKGAQYYKAPFVHRALGTGLGASMWFFLMYRAKQDGAAFLGWKHPWEH